MVQHGVVSHLTLSALVAGGVVVVVCLCVFWLFCHSSSTTTLSELTLRKMQCVLNLFIN